MERAIVVGSGLAGLSAASALLSHNVPVVLLDRAPKPGGNSIKASSGISGAPTRFQLNTDDSSDLFASDTIKSAGLAFANKEEKIWMEPLIRELTKGSAGAIDWLVQEIGVDLSRTVRLGGHSRARTHRGAGKLPPGFVIVSALLKSLQQSPNFELRGNSSVVKISQAEDGSVCGVEYENSEGVSRKLEGLVVFAPGGFAGDAEGMLKRYRPDLESFPSTNDPRSGAHKLLTDIGAQLVDMEHIQIHPTGFIDPASKDSKLKFLAAEALRGEGGILLDKDGQRFVNELATRLEVTQAIMSLESSTGSVKQWEIQIVLDQCSYEAAQGHVDFYILKGLMRRVHFAELSTAVRATLQDYSKVVSGASIDAFDRTAFGHWSTTASVGGNDMFYIGEVTPVIHFTMGGVRIDADARVLDHQCKPIEGVWAAGEITGGIHGENRLGGNSLLECVVFGRKAGEDAARWLSAISMRK